MLDYKIDDNKLWEIWKEGKLIDPQPQIIIFILQWLHMLTKLNI